VSVTVLITISEEDLMEWRRTCAILETVQLRHPASTLTDADITAFWTGYFERTAELLERYGIEGEEADEAKISPYTGDIYIGSED
jgi:hypothetical protein